MHHLGSIGNVWSTRRTSTWNRFAWISETKSVAIKNLNRTPVWACSENLLHLKYLKPAATASLLRNVTVVKGQTYISVCATHSLKHDCSKFVIWISATMQLRMLLCRPKPRFDSWCQVPYQPTNQLRSIDSLKLYLYLYISTRLLATRKASLQMHSESNFNVALASELF